MDWVKLPADWLEKQIEATRREVAQWPPAWRKVAEPPRTVITEFNAIGEPVVTEIRGNG